MKKNLLITLLFALSTSLVFSQADKFWTANFQNAGTITPDKAVARLAYPKEFKLFSLDLQALRQALFSITDNASNHSTAISLPNADGTLEQFEVFEASNFDPQLQALFPEIRAFSGRGITDKYATLKLSISPEGIQTMIFRTDRVSEFIEPYSQNHLIYSVYKSQRAPGQLPWTCSTLDKKTASDLSSKINTSDFTTSSAGQLKTMRLAQSVTAEYSNYFGATSAAQVGLVLAGINATLARCNGVYEKDLAVHLNLIASSVNVIYYNAATDPYSPAATGAGGAWNDELQQTLTSVIGDANYDIGHLFGASGGGGNAGCIGCVCGTGKGSGFTSPADNVPQGDNFDIDYVVHEVGHQLGANHTFSFGLEGTGVNKEIGSGITIMGYAGITNQDVAPHSIDIYHEASIDQIQTNLATKTCPVTTSISANNATPVVAPVSNYTIPKSTPFALTGSATDANAGDALTYCWEQNDNSTTQGANSVASPTKATGPNWLSFSPTASPTRICPILPTILAGNFVTNPLPGGDAIAKIEALSSVGRALHFRLTVRDNHPYSSTAPVAVGQTAFTDMTVTVNAASGPFMVTQPNTNLSWAAGSSQTVTWDVANSTAAPVSCANVKISMSTDGGFTFPNVLSASTANDGSEQVTIPNVAGTTTARVKVEAVGNIFFDISNSNFTVTGLANGYTFNSVTGASVTCGSATAAITLGTTVSGSFTTPINLTATGNPAGTTVTFTPNPLTPGSSTVVSLNNVNMLAPGVYTITITGVAGSVTQTSTLTYTVTANPPGITTNPAPVTTCAGTNAAFNVSAFGAGLSYQWQVSTGGGPFTNIAGAINPTYNIPSVTLAQNGNQYQAVITSACGSSTSTPALLTVTSATSITTQPAAAITACAGIDTTLTVVVAGSTNLSYQWQVSTTGCGGTFTNILGANSASYTISGVTAAQNGYGYRVIITTPCIPSTITSNCTALTVSGSAPSITSQPTPVTVCSGAAANFAVAVSPLTGISYQWQISIGGGAFNNITGATSATYNIPATTVAQSGNQYQVIITTTCGVITSTPVLLTVNAPTSITTNLPTSVLVCAGVDTTFTIQASGGGLSYHWQVSPTGCGGTFNDIPGAFGPSYTVTGITAAFDGYAYRVLVIGNCPPNTVTSNCVALTVSGSAPNITTQPAPVSVCEGLTASFVVAVTPATGVTYQWQVSTDNGTTFSNISGATSATYNIPATTAVNNGNQYQVILTSTCGTSTTVPVTLTVNPTTAITTNLPAITSVCSGTANTFTVAASGSNTYQWQVSTTGCGGTFTNIAGATSPTYTLTGITSAQNGYAYHVVITGTCPAGNITSNCTALTVSTSPGITTQPANVAICSGSNATLTVTASGTGVNFQWQVSTDNGATFTDISGATNSTLTLPAVTGADNNNQYQVILTNTACATPTTSSIAVLTVNNIPSVSVNPVSTNTCNGSTVVFSSTASGTNITYQWQVSTDGGATFTNIAGATNANFTISGVTLALDGNQYHVVVSGVCTPAATSASATLTVVSPVSITSQPSTPAATCAGAGSGLTLTVAGDAGGGTLTFQWQVSTDNGATFTDIPGETNADLVLTDLTADLSGNQYQVILSNGDCPTTVTSIPVTIAVNSAPQVILTATPSPAVLLPGESVTLTATVNPPGSYSFQWEKDGVALTNTTSTLTVSDVDTGAYTVTVSDLTSSCSGKSNTINVSDSLNGGFSIYPNPNNGQFVISYPNPGPLVTKRNVIVFDSHGARVFNKTITLTRTFELINVDLRPAASGVYIVAIFDASGTRLSAQKVVVRR